MKITVGHYGVHELPSKIRFLVQKNGVQTGLDVDLPVSVKVDNYHARCPHAINLAMGVDGDLPEHPLVQRFLPLPRKDPSAMYLADTPQNLELARTLLRLSSVTAGGSPMLLWANPRKLDPFSTNIQPLVASGYTLGNHKTLTQLTTTVGIAPRPLLVLLPEWYAAAQSGFLHPGTLLKDLQGLPLEALGAGILRRYLRHETLPNWME